MNATAIITCPKCGQKLGVQAGSGTVHVTCPKCQAEWDWPAKASSAASARARVTRPSEENATSAGGGPDQRQRWSSSGFSSARHKRRRVRVVTLVFAGLALFIGFRLAGCLLTYTPPKPLPAAAAGLEHSKRAIWDVPPEQPLPDNGYGVFAFDQSAAESMLRVNPRGEQGHIVLKVENSVDDRFVCWLFIRQGETAETRIPAGSYRLKLACGKKWYGETDLFGPGGSYGAIVNEISIPTHTIYTVDLHPSAGGTLRERTLRAEEF